jgi:hypothetical protein
LAIISPLVSFSFDSTISCLSLSLSSAGIEDTFFATDVVCSSSTDSTFMTTEASLLSAPLLSSTLYFIVSFPVNPTFGM